MAMGPDPTGTAAGHAIARMGVESTGAPSPHLASMQCRKSDVQDQFEDVRFITPRRSTVCLFRVGIFAVGQPSKFAALPPPDTQDIL